MKFKIHRGTREIGGSCVEIWTESTRIVVDFGLPLVNPDRTPFNAGILKRMSASELVSQGILPEIEGLYDGSGETSLVISHAHQDHFGLMRYVAPETAVYLGRASLKLIKMTNFVTGKEWEIASPRHFESGSSFRIGNIEITPYLMDHSAFDAYGFLIKADGKALFYSGDFRLHGRKTGTVKWFARNMEENVDCMLLEGTAILRGQSGFPSETELEFEFVRHFRESRGMILVYTSGQNIDRLVTIYRACLKAERLMAVDFYIANILKDLSEFATLPYPSKEFPGIKVFYPSRISHLFTRKGEEKKLFRFRHFKISRDEIDARAGRIVMLVRPSMIGYLERLNNLDGGLFIYSMWHGYRKERKTGDFIEFLRDRGMDETEIHTSGHADRDALLRMVEVVNPKKIIPIHTFDGDEYQNVFGPDRVLRIEDRQEVEII